MTAAYTISLLTHGAVPSKKTKPHTKEKGFEQPTVFSSSSTYHVGDEPWNRKLLTPPSNKHLCCKKMFDMHQHQYWLYGFLFYFWLVLYRTTNSTVSSLVS